VSVRENRAASSGLQSEVRRRREEGRSWRSDAPSSLSADGEERTSERERRRVVSKRQRRAFSFFDFFSASDALPSFA
jgi:hypothetical protein